MARFMAGTECGTASGIAREGVLVAGMLPLPTLPKLLPRPRITSSMLPAAAPTSSPRGTLGVKNASSLAPPLLVSRMVSSPSRADGRLYCLRTSLGCSAAVASTACPRDSRRSSQSSSTGATGVACSSPRALMLPASGEPDGAPNPCRAVLTLTDANAAPAIGPTAVGMTPGATPARKPATRDSAERALLALPGPADTAPGAPPLSPPAREPSATRYRYDTTAYSSAEAASVSVAVRLVLEPRAVSDAS